MRFLTSGDTFRIPAFLYGALTYGGILLLLISIGMATFCAIKKKEKKCGKDCLVTLIIAVLMLIPMILAAILGLWESMA